MAITIGNGDLSLGGAVVTDVGGTIYAVFENANTVEVWSDVDTVPNLEDSDTAATIFGGGNIEWVHAAIAQAPTSFTLSVYVIASRPGMWHGHHSILPQVLLVPGKL